MSRVKKLLGSFLLITLICCKTFAIEELNVNANAALIIETNTGKVIYEKDGDEQNYPASVTKILTAILVLENCNLDDVAIASESAISQIPDGYVVAPLKVGEEMKIKDLLYALMLKSANDAAYVLAEHVGENVDFFADMMNQKAKEIGCTGSHFVNPNGIHNERHYTTANDMYLIAKYAMKNEEFVKIVSTMEYTLPATNKYEAEDRVMRNTNSFINPDSSFYNKNVRGIKTGTTAQAGNCLITDVARDGLEFITVLLGAETSNGKFSETEKMINYAYDNYTLTKIHSKGDVIKTIEIENATEETKSLNVLIDREIIVINNKENDANKTIPDIKLNDEILAPIMAGDELGTISFDVDGLQYDAKLIAANDVEKRTYYKEIGIGSAVAVVFLTFITRKPKKKKNIY
ncbi:MAG: D-alanyl-D-alanine carboxypeptidase [Clostridia bacterium]|nr:D-alanyl-D-alanine carboxypeptidase [Clostridia bacterium]